MLKGVACCVLLASGLLRGVVGRITFSLESGLLERYLNLSCNKNEIHRTLQVYSKQLPNIEHCITELL
jgi:hypothetical protein